MTNGSDPSSFATGSIEGRQKIRMDWEITTKPITHGYARNFVFYLGADALGDGKFRGGQKVTVSYVDNDNELIEEGALQATGVLSGMAPFYRILKLPIGARIKLFCSVSEAQVQTARIVEVIRPAGAEQLEPAAAQLPQATPVLTRLAARYVHFDMYRHELAADWEPSGEADVYLAFGSLQDYTDYIYCCGVNVQVLRTLGVQDKFEERKSQNGREGIPDALLVERTTRRYLLTEFKMRSSDFAKNHSADLIDVLVCWEDDERDRSLLPPAVVALRDKAREAARDVLING